MISRETIQRGFPIKPLGEVAEFLDSRRRPITASERTPGPYPYYGANGQQDSVENYLFDEPLILLAEDGGRFDQPDRGIAYAIEGKTWVNNHAHVLRPRAHAQLRYLVRVLENYDVTPWITGSTRAKLTKAGASKIQIPLPPRAEQKRIARILDAADALRAKRREALAQLDALLQSAFLDMFGDPVTNPMAWDAPPLADFCRTGTGGTPSRRKMQRYYEGGTIPWVKSGELREEVISSTGECITDAALRETNVKLVPKDALLLALYGATVGRLGILGIQATTNQAVCHIIPNSLRVDFRFMFHSLSNQVSYLVGRGVGGAQPNISQGIIKSLAIPLPPLNLQRRFAVIVESVEEQKGRQRAHLAELDTLFASLQSRAFRGDL